MSDTGHFGLQAHLIGGAALLALILHLAVPFGIEDFNGETDTVSRGDMADNYDAFGHGDPSVTLAGIILWLIGGVALVVLGFVPMPVGVARWLGWSSGLLAVIGGMMAMVSSMLWVGGGFSTLWNQISQDGGFWVISPVVVAALSVAGLWWCLQVMQNVLSRKHRAHADNNHWEARWAIGFALLMLLVPWSMETDEGDARFYDGFSVLNFNTLTDGAMFDGLSMALEVFIATAWIGVLAAVLANVGTLLADTAKVDALVRFAPMIRFATTFMLAFTAIMYLLAWAILWRPNSDADGFLPGWFPILVLGALIPWILFHIRFVKGVIGGGKSGSGRARKPVKKVNFD